jgi:hypothetical protein
MTNYKITIKNHTTPRFESEYRNRKDMSLEEAIERATRKAYGRPCDFRQNYGLPEGYGSFVHECGCVEGTGFIEIETI